MTSSDLRSKFRRSLSKQRGGALVVSDMALAPETKAVEEIKIPKLSCTSKDLLVGEEIKISVKNKTQNSTCKWKSSNRSVATVNRKGLVRGIAKGKAKIICTIKSPVKTYKLICEVIVRIPVKTNTNITTDDTKAIVVEDTIETYTIENNMIECKVIESEVSEEIIITPEPASDKTIEELSTALVFSTPAIPSTPVLSTSTPSIPSTSSTLLLNDDKITINNPGDVFCGTLVTMEADRTDVIWTVYGYIDDSNGYAIIDPYTGVLNPIETGTVRVVAVSKTNSSIYGAVDLVIQGKKFIGILPLDDIYLDSDEALAGIYELERSGKLPTKVTLVYETGVDNETENIEVQLPANGWTGSYNGTQTGANLIHRYISVPSGYEAPSDLYADVVIHVNVPQTDKRLAVVGTEDIPHINLSTDEHCVSIDSLFSKYLYNYPIKLKLADESTRFGLVTGYTVDKANPFNGTVPGSYKVDLLADLEAGLVYRNVKRFSEDSVSWTDYDYIPVTVTIDVTIAQTPVSGAGYSGMTIPDTTQPKFIPENKEAEINSVEFNDLPGSVNYGDVLDLSKYVMVNTTSKMPSDQRVIWSVNGYTLYRGNLSNNGRVIMNNTGSHIIRATSAVDPSKYSEAIVSVSGGAITSFKSFERMNILEDMGIVNFKTLYKTLKKELPTTVTATTVNGNCIIAITGWVLKTYTTDSYIIRPEIDTWLEYNYGELPELQVKLFTHQSDKRNVITTVMPERDSITIKDDINATTVFNLMNALYKYPRITSVPLNVILENGKSMTIKCNINSYWLQDTENYLLYRGKPGNYILHMEQSLPEDYVWMGSDAINLQIPLTLEVAQTPRHDNIWVSQEPDKMTYNSGDMFDLSGIIIMLGNTSTAEGDVIYNHISSEQLPNYNLKFYIKDNNMVEKDITKTSLTKDMDGKYVYVHNSDNNSYTFFGPITVND